MSDSRIDLGRRVNLAWLSLIERVNEAERDGYDVRAPVDVLAEALHGVAMVQIAAWQSGKARTYEQQAESFIQCYTDAIADIDRLYPPRS